MYSTEYIYTAQSTAADEPPAVHRPLTALCVGGSARAVRREARRFAGGTIGPAITFGFLAAEAAARDDR